MRWWLSVLVVLCLAIVAPAAENPDLAAQVRKCVRQLDADTVKERDEARDKLLQLGPEALPLIQPILQDAARSEQVRNALQQVVTKLQGSQAASALQATPVMLSGELPLADVFAAFTAQTGNKIIDFRKRFGGDAPNPKIKCNFEKTPFWTALDQVLDQAHLTIYGFSGQDGVAVIANRDGAPPRYGKATYQGPFRIEPTKILAERDLRDADGGLLKIFFEVSWEPRLELISIEQSLENITAIDDQGQKLVLDAATKTRGILVTPHATQTTLDVPLKLPARQAKKLASVQGTLTARILGPAQEFKFTDLKNAKNVSQTNGPVKVTLQQVRKNNDLWQASVMVALAAGSGVESHANWVTRNEVMLLGPEQKRVAAAGMEAFGGNGHNEIGANYLFTDVTKIEDYTLVYKSPIPAPDAAIQIHLKDIELP